MADFNYTGGVRFAPDKVVDVTADKDGNPTKACNPITGVCLGGGDISAQGHNELTITNNTSSLAQVAFLRYGDENGNSMFWPLQINITAGNTNSIYNPELGSFGALINGEYIIKHDRNTVVAATGATIRTVDVTVGYSVTYIKPNTADGDIAISLSNT